VHHRTCITVAIAAAVGIIGMACGGSSTTTSSSGNQADPTATIQVYSQKDPGLEGLLEQQISDFTRAHPTITVKVVHYETEQLRTNFQTAAITHGGPEIVYGPNDNIGPWVALKIIKPLDQVLGRRFFEPFQPAAVGASSYKGHMYAIPDVYGNHLMLLYNKRLVTKAPTTTDELLSVARGLTDPVGGKFGLVFYENEAYWLMPWLGGFGGQVFDKSTRPTLDTAAMVNALKFEKSMKADGVANQPADYDEADSLFKAGQAAMIINGDWSLAEYKDTLSADFGVAPLPQVTATARWAAPYTATRGYSINAAASGDQLAAAKIFLRWISQVRENVRIAQYGDIPAVTAAANGPAVKSDPILTASAVALTHGTPQPIVPQMRAIYDAIKTPLADVMSGKLDPAAAARQMQDDAVRRIQQRQQ